MNARDDDLLQPTLAADLDVRAYGRLFRPQSVLWPSFFGGPLAGATLFGINYARMGRRDLALRCWIGGVLLALVLATAVAWYLSGGWGATVGSQRPETRWMRYVVSGTSVAIGWFIAKNQAPRYTAWEGAGNAPANLWLPGILAVIAGAILFIGATFGALSTFRAYD